MPGYIMNLSSRESLEAYVRSGAYGTIIKRPRRGFWSTPAEMTLADYLTMRPGDLIFFFLKRQIYGVGRLIGFPVEGEHWVALCNFPGSSSAHEPPPGNPEAYLWRENGEENIRWVVFFEHAPHFFAQGLDMDEVLQADTKRVVRSLRAFEKRSFIQIDDEEAQVILDLLVRRNEDVLEDPQGHQARVFPDESQGVHAAVAGRDLGAHRVEVEPLLHRHAAGDKILHEALIEAWLVGQLTNRREPVTQVFGEWDYVANQVPASPQKPVCYMDRIDVFGEVSRRLADHLPPTTVRYKIIEIKKDAVASDGTIGQLMKYVDWTAHTRCGGDYSMVDAFLVAYDFTVDVVDSLERTATRRFLIPRRPYRGETWQGLTLVRYRHTAGTPALVMDPVA